MRDCLPGPEALKPAMTEGSSLGLTRCFGAGSGGRPWGAGVDGCGCVHTVVCGVGYDEGAEDFCRGRLRGWRGLRRWSILGVHRRHTPVKLKES
jgi:hypothetical protein